MHCLFISQGRLAPRPISSDAIQSVNVPDSVSVLFRPRAYEGEVPSAQPTNVLAALSTSGSLPPPTQKPKTTRPPPPVTAAAGTTGSWFVEFESPGTASKFMSAMASGAKGVTSHATAALISLQSDRSASVLSVTATPSSDVTGCLVAAVAEDGQVLWLPVDTAEVTAMDINAYIQVNTLFSVRNWLYSIGSIDCFDMCGLL